MFFDMLENYNLETKHYVILTVLGVVEVILFALMFYNCCLEYRQKRRERIYQYNNLPKADEEKPKPSLMEIFSVDMTLNSVHHNHNNNNQEQAHPHSRCNTL